MVLAAGVAVCAESEQPSNASAEEATTGTTLANFPSLVWSDGMCTFIGSLNAALGYLGEKTTYKYLMGVSGAAFATRFDPNWRASSVDAALNDDHPSLALGAASYSYEWVQTSDPAAIVKSLDAGVPVLALNPGGRDGWGLIFGYRHNGEELICRTYSDKDGPTTIGSVPSTLLVIGRKCKGASLEESVRASLLAAVLFGKGERKVKGFEVGPAAYDAWIAALGSKKLDSLSGKALEEKAYINALTYNLLIDARVAAVSYLQSVGYVLTDEKDLILEAERLYQEEVDILMGAKDFVKYPQNIKSGPKWTAGMRAYQAEALRRAAEKDRAAVLALEKLAPDEKPAGGK